MPIEFEELERDPEPEVPLLPRPYLTRLVPTPERELDRLFSSYRAAQRRLEMEALRGGPPIDVSGYESDFVGVKTERQARAEALIELSIARQQDAVKVARNIRRTERLLSEARGDRVTKKFGTAYVPGRSASANPRTIYGTEAWIRPWVHGHYASFATKGIALPCLERTTRRQVLFAKKKAKGWRVKHRINAISHIWC